ncbi:MAG: hypothetical protein L0Y66_08175 [Myxococcaceae bacterium]|nr:hypothetical protein [Myxococcaceae bacterium]MCI0670385.1 hypothetical protein [Myxococcaceae bacterium]
MMTMMWGSWLLWGFVATVVLTTLMAASQGLGFTRMNMPYLLGTMLTTDRDRAHVVGVLMHLASGWAFSLVYVLTFLAWGKSGVWRGALIGVVHAAFVLVVGMPMLLPGLHPWMVSEQHAGVHVRQLEPPGFLGLHYGMRTPISVLVSHVVFGAILGAFVHV